MLTILLENEIFLANLPLANDYSPEGLLDNDEIPEVDWRNNDTSSEQS